MRIRKKTHVRPASRLLSMLLTAAMIFSMVGMNIFAQTGSVVLAAEDSAEVYTISTLDEYQAFAALVAGGDTFADKTVKLLADISGVSATTGSSSKKFAGTFDGGGHTITVTISGTTYQGLFGYNNGTIQNLVVAGTVSGSMYGGCLAGYNNGVIESCINEADGTFSGSYVGGFCGFNSKSATVENCINRGDITTTASAGYCGGIAGSNSGSVRNCYNIGSVGNSTKSFAIVGAGTGTVENCYFLTGGTDAKATEKTEEEMKDSAFVALLGNGFNYLEGSYPVLSWQGGTPIEGDSHTEHTYGEWVSLGDKEHSRTCTWEGCDESQTEPHEWNDGEVTKEPTAEEPGIMTYTCTVCHEVKTEDIPATAKKVTISFYDGETLYSSVVINAGEKVSAPEDNPSNTNYTFLYWSAEPDGTAYDFDTVVTEDISLYAVWQDKALTDWDFELIDDGNAVKLTHYKGTSSTVITPETINQIPVTTIGSNTFTGNTNITYVWMKDSITTVEDGTGFNGGAFRGCSKLRTIIFSENISRIADYMFYGIASEINYPVQINFANVKEIGDYAFSCCNNIVNLVLPESVTTIGEGAFYQARRLKTLEIPGVVEIGADAFTETIFEENYENAWKAGEFSGIVYAGNVAYIYMGDDVSNKAMSENTVLMIKDGTVGISSFLFDNHYSDLASCRRNLLALTIPASVSFIASDLLDDFNAVTDGEFTGVDLYGLKDSYAEEYASDYENVRFRPLNAQSKYDDSDLDYGWYDNATDKNYVIRNADELRAFADLLDTDEDDFAGSTIILEADIDLGGLTEQGNYGIDGFAWSTSFAGDFAGTFDGQGHTISGVYMNCKQDYVGFFDKLAGTAVVKNLTVEGKIIGRDYVGGIVGSSASEAQITNCCYRGIVEGCSDYGYVGGIVGRAMKTTISGCEAYGMVSCIQNETYRELQQGYVGGICGHNYGSTIVDCINHAAVIGNGYGTGGITGFSQLASVENSENQGDVSGSENVGGIAGKITVSGTMGLHKNCVNKGSVNGINKVGGIAGISVGVVTVGEEFQTIYGCSNQGTISAQNHCAGICGYIHDSAVDHCWNEGSISAGQYSGGIGGYVLGAPVRNCYNTGEISASLDYAGGILAFDADNESSLTNCYNVGTVSAETHSSPLANVFGDASCNQNNCYYVSENTEDPAAKNTAAFESGEVAYLLGGSYGQLIGTENHPVLNDENSVYRYTACDGITVLYTNNNALSETTADHLYGEWTVTKAPTCVETGEASRGCLNCSHMENKELAANGHSEVVDPAVEATCTESGLTEGSHCQVCGEILVEQEVIEASGHHFESGKCTVCGEKDPSASDNTGPIIDAITKGIRSLVNTCKKLLEKFLPVPWFNSADI